MLNVMFISSCPTHRVCQRDEKGKVVNCTYEYWNSTYAQIACSALPIEFVQCITHSFEKFQNEFEPGSLPQNGCPNGHRSESSYGTAVCRPLSGISCIGEHYWLNTSFPCYEDSDYNVITTFLLSFFLGLFGADRFYLNYYFLGIIKLFTLGGFGIWWVIDFVLLALGVWGPKGDNGYSLRF